MKALLTLRAGRRRPAAFVRLADPCEHVLDALGFVRGRIVRSHGFPIFFKVRRRYLKIALDHECAVVLEGWTSKGPWEPVQR